MELWSVLSVGVGAALGAWLRWVLGLALNPLLPTLPLGTLATNLLGGYLVGVGVAFFSQQPVVSSEVRLFVITGFLGGLTTFSTFSAEVVGLLQQQAYPWALTVAAAHLLGSLAMTALGMWTMQS